MGITPDGLVMIAVALASIPWWLFLLYIVKGIRA
jgi:hypothetical protein